MLSPLKERLLEPEWMDDPALGRDLHTQALAGLERINAFSGSSKILWPAIRSLAQESKAHSLKILDIATGGGDVPIRLWRTALQAGLTLRIDGCDRSPRAIEHARRQAGRTGADVRFFVHDLLSSGVLPGYDVLVSSLFFHHLSVEQTGKLLADMADRTEKLIAVNDLRRGAPGLALAYLGTRILTRSPVVHADGPRSVRAAFTVPEIRTLAQRAGLTGCRVARRWPCRFLLTWRKPKRV